MKGAASFSIFAIMIFSFISQQFSMFDRLLISPDHEKRTILLINHPYIWSFDFVSFSSHLLSPPSYFHSYFLPYSSGTFYLNILSSFFFPSSVLRTVTIGSGPFSEDDLDSLPRLYKFHKQLTLLSSLQGKQWGKLEKIQRLKQAELQGILPKTFASNDIKVNSVMDDKLLDDWNFDMNA